MKSNSYPSGSAIRDICKHGEEAMRTIRQLEYLETLLKVNPVMGNLLWKKFYKREEVINEGE